MTTKTPPVSQQLVTSNTPQPVEAAPHKQSSPNRPADIGFSKEERQLVALKHYGLVKSIARRIHARLPRSVELDDLIHEGFAGLLEAMDRYDNYSRVPIQLFARQRVTGAILDMLRNLDWVPRTVRRRAELIENTRVYLYERLGRSPTREEMAAQLDLAPSKFDRMERNAEIRKVSSLDVCNAPNSETPLIETLPMAGNYVEERCEQELIGALVEAVDRLPPKERDAVRGFYLEERPLLDVGGQLGVSESRASQLHRRGVGRLRYKIREHLEA